MTSELADVIKLLGYILAGWFIVRKLSGGWREFAFAALNLSVLYFVFFHGADGRYKPTFLAYLALIVFQYAMLRVFAQSEGWKPWLAFFTPILALVFVRYIPPSLYSSTHLPYGPFFVGISYLAFRCSHLVLEVRNGTVKMPGFFEYLGFSFFVPTMSVGPINPYSNFRRGFESEPPAIPVGRSLLRILVGMVKYKFLGSIFFQLTYSNLLLDDHYHPWIDLPIAAIFYYLFLYSNFSGFCDMAIGAAGLIGIPVIENFNDPFAAPQHARVLESLAYFALAIHARRLLLASLEISGPRARPGQCQSRHRADDHGRVPFDRPLARHGMELSHVWISQRRGGHRHALLHHWFEKVLGRDGFKAYNSNRWIYAAAAVITFCYFSMTLFFFANTPEQMKAIWSILR